jgi:hypothetical protein
MPKFAQGSQVAAFSKAGRVLALQKQNWHEMVYTLLDASQRGSAGCDCFVRILLLDGRNVRVTTAQGGCLIPRCGFHARFNSRRLRYLQEIDGAPISHVGDAADRNSNARPDQAIGFFARVDFVSARGQLA